MKRKVRFNLKKPFPPNAKSVSVLLFFTYVKGSRIVRSTGIFVNPGHWDQKKQRLDPKKPGAEKVNAQLDRIAGDIIQAYDNLLIRNQAKARHTGKEIAPISREEIDREVDIIQGRAKPSSSVLAFLTRKIEERPKRSTFSKGSITVYNNMKNLVEEFAGQRGTPDRLSFDNLNFNWFERFRDFLLVEKKLSMNYSHRMIKALLALLREGLRDTPKAHQNLDVALVKPGDLNMKFEESDHAYLTLEEIRKLHRLEIKDDPGMVRDKSNFIVACLTGLRVSDWPKVDLNNGTVIIVDGIEFLKVMPTKKTRAKKRFVYIPILPYTKEVLEKYDGALDVKTGQYIGRQLKDACRLAGIDEEFARIESRVKKDKVIKGPKWKFVSSHTGRRSFVSNARRVGMPDEYFELLTGHKVGGNRKTIISTYDRRTDIERLEEAAKYLKKMSILLESEEEARIKQMKVAK